MDTNGHKDSNGNGCDWYDVGYNNNKCNNFNTPEFNAGELCQVCNGGYKYKMECRSDATATNSNGRTCNNHYWWLDWSLPDSEITICSTRNDTQSFKVNDACCFCGGGTITWGELESPMPTQTVEACFDTNYFSDIRGFGVDCRWYADNVQECGAYDSLRFRASDMCCVCGGGMTR